MFGSILILFVLPWLDTSRVRSARYRPVYKWFFWVLVVDCIVLGWVGANPPEGWFVVLGQVSTFYYFFHFLVLLPILGKIERPRPLPTRSEEHTSELQSLMRISYAVFGLKKKKTNKQT